MPGSPWPCPDWAGAGAASAASASAASSGTVPLKRIGKPPRRAEPSQDPRPVVKGLTAVVQRFTVGLPATPTGRRISMDGEVLTEGAVAAQVSGLYERDAVPGEGGKEELRLDVDAHYPQLMASGVIRRPPAVTLEWAATLTETATDTWAGPVVFERSPDASFPWTRAQITVTR